MTPTAIQAPKLPLPIITLLTDFGTRDAYVAAMKGVILGLNPRAVLVDVTHEVPAQDILTGLSFWPRRLPISLRAPFIWRWWTQEWARAAGAWRLPPGASFGWDRTTVSFNGPGPAAPTWPSSP